MLKIAHHTAYIHPLREGHRFPMVKYELIPAQLLYEGIVDKDSFFEPKLADFETCCLGHEREYVQHLFDLTLDAKMVRRIGFPLSQSLVERERYILDGTIQSALYAMEYGISFNTAGGTHHAGHDYGEGFCLMNDQAVASQYLLSKGLAKKILIIDLDVHQGNGTAHIFLHNPDVFTFSMHGAKNFPFIKEKSDLDIELQDGISDTEYLSLLLSHLDELFERVKPDFVFYQAGVDILSSDKLGKLKVSKEGCKQRDYLVINRCHQLRIPIQISMGGGYSTHIKDIVDAHVATYKTAVDIFDF
ncbi:MAG: histone deacetylase [Sphingobacterium composti]|uniref:histone deacetylase family protein n=1 Tax=Sphingobacterium composti TaxID=363260 RepID=UPI001F271FDC|nr:histone deacetylase [Sphingobacterium composti Ten et al. 2007 non Yoo et al. 2007]